MVVIHKGQYTTYIAVRLLFILSIFIKTHPTYTKEIHFDRGQHLRKGYNQ